MSFDFDKWVNPTTVVILFGAVVWGIQLNVVVLDHTEKLAKNTTKNELQDSELRAHSEALIRLSTILDSLERRVEKNTVHSRSHETESEEWKRIIMQNESRISNIENHN